MVQVRGGQGWLEQVLRTWRESKGSKRNILEVGTRRFRDSLNVRNEIEGKIEDDSL